MLEGVPTPMFHVVLHEPEIPNNTGNIGRTCVATRCALHLIHPLGFDVSVKACRRAGLDYWPRLDVSEHDSWDEFVQWHDADVQPPKMWFFTTGAGRPHWEADFHPGDRLVFGKETRGLPDEILTSQGQSNLLRLPMAPGERSLNLATAVCAAVYEGMRQCAMRGDVVWKEGGFSQTHSSK